MAGCDEERTVKGRPVAVEDLAEAKRQLSPAAGALGAREVRESEAGVVIEVAELRAFLRSALGDDALVDRVNDLIFDHIAGGLYLKEILDTATDADWQAVADDLIAEGHDLLQEG